MYERNRVDIRMIIYFNGQKLISDQINFFEKKLFDYYNLSFFKYYRRGAHYHFFLLQLNTDKRSS